MATIVETVERDGVKVLVYNNGMERNAETGRITKPADNTMITAENASDFHRARREIKYQRAQAGANRALAALRNKEMKDGKWVDAGPAWENPQDLDYVEAIAEAQTAQALLVGDPSSTKAAEWVMRHTGQDERQVGTGGDEADVTVVRQAIRALLAAVNQRDSADIIDGSTIPDKLRETNSAENDG